MSVPALLGKVFAFGHRHILCAQPLVLTVQDMPPHCLVNIGPFLVEAFFAMSIPAGALFVCIRARGAVVVVRVREGCLCSSLINNLIAVVQRNELLGCCCLVTCSQQFGQQIGDCKHVARVTPTCCHSSYTYLLPQYIYLLRQYIYVYFVATLHQFASPLATATWCGTAATATCCHIAMQLLLRPCVPLQLLVRHRATATCCHIAMRCHRSYSYTLQLHADGGIWSHLG